MKLRIREQIWPVIPRTYLLSRPELAGLTILRCARGTNFRVSQDQAVVLDKIVAANTTFTKQIYITWCCLDLSNAPRLPGTE